MADGNEFSIAGEFPKPAGAYAISLAAGVLKIVREENKIEFQADAIELVLCGWAVPAKGGGYVDLALRLKDGSEKLLFMSNGYYYELRDQYIVLAKDVAAKLNVPFKETPLGADA